MHLFVVCCAAINSLMCSEIVHPVQVIKPRSQHHEKTFCPFSGLPPAKEGSDVVLDMFSITAQAQTKFYYNFLAYQGFYVQGGKIFWARKDKQKQKKKVAISKRELDRFSMVNHEFFISAINARP